MRKITAQASNALLNLEPFRRTGNGRTEVETTDNSEFGILLLHGNHVASYDKGAETLVVRDAGWQTVTTKERINGVLITFGIPCSVYQEKGEWYIWNRETKETKKWEGQHTFCTVTKKLY